MKYLYIVGTVVFTVYGQLILKWRIGLLGSMPEAFLAKLLFLFGLFGDIYILSGFAAAFIASLFWMAAMTTFELSNAYPIITGGLVMLTSILAIVAFNESLSSNKVIGIALILLGVLIVHRSGHAG